MAEVTGMTPDKISQEITKETTNLKTYVNSNLSRKADTTYVDSGLSKKADITYVDSGLSKKADTTYVNSELSKKADITDVNSELSKKADKIQVTSDLSTKADITYVDSLTPLKSFAGTGSPEGKITAPVGSIYVDSASTNGAIRWVKTIAAGSTGWGVEYGDTGWREIVPINGWAGSIYIRRINSTVYYRGKIDAKAATSSAAWDIPPGFRIGNILSTQGQGYEYGRAIVSTDENEPKIRNVKFYFSRFSINGYSKAHAYGINVSHPTTIDWPSTLPGTPA